MIENNHKGQLICRQELRDHLPFKCPIYKCKQQDFSVVLENIQSRWREEMVDSHIRL